MAYPSLDADGGLTLRSQVRLFQANDAPAAILRQVPSGTTDVFRVLATSNNTLFSVGADGTTAGKCVRFGRAGDANYNELSGGPAPIWRTSTQNPDTTANTILFTMAALSLQFTDSVTAENMRLGDTHGGAYRALLTGQGGNAFSRLAISSVYTIFTHATGADIEIPVGLEMVRIHNDAISGVDGAIPLRLETSLTTQTGHLFDIVSAVTGNQPFFVDNKSLLVASIRTDSWIVDAADPTKKLALDVSGIPTGTSRLWTALNGSGSVPLMVKTLRRTNLSAADGSPLTLTAIAVAGLYRFHVSILCTSAGTPSDDAQVTLNWNDGTARSWTFFTHAGNNHNVDSLNELSSEFITIYCTTVTTTYQITSVTGTVTFDLIIDVERVG